MTPAKRIDDACTVLNMYGGARRKVSTVVLMPFSIRQKLEYRYAA